MKTKKETEYRVMPYGKVATIPAGTPVVPADNVPEGGYWVLPWRGMDEAVKSWHRNYGFRVSADEVTKED
tara:strand:- start:293 stop:502 length:210 start_codon:yes stop_codon:yes gene_type:complete